MFQKVLIFLVIFLSLLVAGFIFLLNGEMKTDRISDKHHERRAREYQDIIRAISLSYEIEWEQLEPVLRKDFEIDNLEHYGRFDTYGCIISSKHYDDWDAEKYGYYDNLAIELDKYKRLKYVAKYKP